MTKDMPKRLALGIDIGSTTAKICLMDGERVLYEKYERHFSQVRQKTLEMLSDVHGAATAAGANFWSLPSAAPQVLWHGGGRGRTLCAGGITPRATAMREI